jgi:Methyltransferase FkbM domain
LGNERDYTHEKASAVLHLKESTQKALGRDHDWETQTVRIVKLDDFLGPKLERLDFVKIDTEGYEDEVPTGAVELIQKFKPIIYIELCSEYLISSQNAGRFLRHHGYTFDRELALDESSNWGELLCFSAGYAVRQPSWLPRRQNGITLHRSPTPSDRTQVARYLCVSDPAVLSDSYGFKVVPPRHHKLVDDEKTLVPASRVDAVRDVR